MENDECAICFEDKIMYIQLPCHKDHNMCIKCWNDYKKRKDGNICLICRSKFVKYETQYNHKIIEKYFYNFISTKDFENLNKFYNNYNCKYFKELIDDYLLSNFESSNNNKEICKFLINIGDKSEILYKNIIHQLSDDKIKINRTPKCMKLYNLAKYLTNEMCRVSQEIKSSYLNKVNLTKEKFKGIRINIFDINNTWLNIDDYIMNPSQVYFYTRILNYQNNDDLFFKNLPLDLNYEEKKYLAKNYLDVIHCLLNDISDIYSLKKEHEKQDINDFIQKMENVMNTRNSVHKFLEVNMNGINAIIKEVDLINYLMIENQNKDNTEHIKSIIINEIKNLENRKLFKFKFNDTHYYLHNSWDHESVFGGLIVRMCKQKYNEGINKDELYDNIKQKLILGKIDFNLIDYYFENYIEYTVKSLIAREYIEFRNKKYYFLP